MANGTCIRVYADSIQINRCRAVIEKVTPEITELSQIFSMAGNTVRLKILYLLWHQGKLCVCDLSDILNMTAPAISQHLKKLKSANMIRSERVAQTVFHSLVPETSTMMQVFFEEMNPEKEIEHG